MEKRFKLNIINLFKDTWKASFKNFFYFALVVDLLMIFSNIPDQLLKDNDSFIAILVSVFIFILQPWITLGIINMSLNVIDGKEISYKDFIFDIVYIARFVGLSLLAGIIILFMFLLFFIPGIITAMALMFVSYVYVDKKLSIFECLSESQKMTYGKKLEIFKVWLILLVFNLIGVLLFGIGLLFTIPFSFILVAYLYRGIQEDYFMVVKNSVTIKKSFKKNPIKKVTKKRDSKTVLKKKSTAKKIVNKSTKKTIKK